LNKKGIKIELKKIFIFETLYLKKISICNFFFIFFYFSTYFSLNNEFSNFSLSLSLSPSLSIYEIFDIKINILYFHDILIELPEKYVW